LRLVVFFFFGAAFEVAFLRTAFFFAITLLLLKRLKGETNIRQAIARPSQKARRFFLVALYKLCSFIKNLQ
jgi:hypothetical protein